MDTKTIPYSMPIYSSEEMKERSKSFYQWIDKRRTVRDFSDKAVDPEIIDNCILSASSAPSGANKQPWTFCVVSDPEIKKRIRVEAEKEEYENYHGRMSKEWLDDLAAIGTDWHKPFLEIAPYLIVVFKRVYEMQEGEIHNNYYVQESVGLACGFLLTALFNAGLAALTHTPSPMNFLAKILSRPSNERPFLLIPVGYPAENTHVPDLNRKGLEDIRVKY
ncbi:MAG: nitroreductase family protein [Bacteroidetes bacterium]|nr:MAG: nitroreductase family protein [Bacteroidota bacterium]REK04943.1 MAG: nitroreductase family protein [Bacteroidota bacterium]REK36553.1 MAG: nitroreductase family protein [Bacteroidota bacterium]REK50919.1 MAG: nitroreductase family protein [Bacteroidota bacterium]